MNENLKLELAKHTKLELAEIVADLTDGEDASDIHHSTGLPRERCETIAEIGHSLATAIWR